MVWANIADAGIPLPDTKDRELAPFWTGCREGELRVQRVRSTGLLQWPPRGSAVGRPEFDLEWVPIARTGTLYSWTVVAQTVLPGYSQLTPYAVGVVEIDGTAIRMAGFIDEDPGTLIAEEPLTAHFIPIDHDVTLPVWRRA